MNNTGFEIDENRIGFAVMNFLVWGLGFLGLKQYKKGLLWLTAYLLLQTGFYMLGWSFLLLTLPGKLAISGCLMVSLNLALEAYYGGRS